MQRQSLRTHGSGIGTLAGLLDVAAVLIGGVLALLWRFGTLDRHHQLYLLVLVLAAALVLALFPLLGVYRSWRARGMRAPVAAALAAWGLVFALTLIALVGLKENELLSRWWLVQWFVLTALLNALGWRAEIPLEAGVRATYQWYLDNVADSKAVA